MFKSEVSCTSSASSRALNFEFYFLLPVKMCFCFICAHLLGITTHWTSKWPSSKDMSSVYNLYSKQFLFSNMFCVYSELGFGSWPNILRNTSWLLYTICLNTCSLLPLEPKLMSLMLCTGLREENCRWWDWAQALYWPILRLLEMRGQACECSLPGCAHACVHNPSEKPVVHVLFCSFHLLN
jgi:hypothetical protein